MSVVFGLYIVFTMVLSNCIDTSKLNIIKVQCVFYKSFFGHQTKPVEGNEHDMVVKWLKIIFWSFLNKISCWPDFRTFFSHEIHEEEKSITNSIRHIQKPFQNALLPLFRGSNHLLNVEIYEEQENKSMFYDNWIWLKLT